MDTITKQLADALRDAIGDCHEVINSRVQSLGENYRPHVLAAMRKAVAEKESILAAYDIQALQQARQPLTPSELAVAKRCANIAGKYGLADWSVSGEIRREIRTEFGITGEQPHG